MIYGDFPGAFFSGTAPKHSSAADKAGIGTRDPSEIPICIDRGPGNGKSFQIPTLPARHTQRARSRLGGAENRSLKDSNDLQGLPWGDFPGTAPKYSSAADKAGIRTRDPSEIPIYMDRGPGNVKSFQIPTAVIREWLIQSFVNGLHGHS